MAFSFANVAAGLGSNDSGLKVQDGPELQEIQTDQLGFNAVNGEAKVRLLPGTWPEDNLPIPSAALLAVASSQELVAAGGPDGVVLVGTETVRNALRAKTDDSIRSIDPLLKISHTRPSHVAFSADESVLLVSEQAGGIVAYQVEQLRNGQANPALILDTNRTGLRNLVPNPAVQSAQLVACVTVQGELLIADLSTGQLVSGPDGPVLQNNVSCASWSSKGKQLVAGKNDGTAVQLKPDGSIQARIPKSTSIPDHVHISAICWLETHCFLFLYSPNTDDADQGIPVSDYYIVNREGTQFTFSKLPEVLPLFGLPRLPTHHHILRLKNFKPHITDLVLMSASTASEVGIISKADAPLSKVDAVTHAFTFTTIDDDSRRAELPLSNGADTSPIGMALDLSAKTGIVNPIPSDPEIEQSQGPVPNLLVLNQEGILCSWWIIYNDSIRQKTTFSGFDALSTMAQARSAVSPEPSTSQIEDRQNSESANTFSTPGQAFSQSQQFGASPFAAPSSTFGASTQATSFGTGSSFNTTSTIGANKSSWASTGFSNSASADTGSAFGRPGFGQQSMGTPTQANGTTPAFGASGIMGHRPTPFSQPSGSAFGQSGFANKAAGGAFGQTSSSSPFVAAGASSSSLGSGFASFASKGGFGVTSGDKKDQGQSNPFFKQGQDGTTFGQGNSVLSPFAAPASSTFAGNDRKDDSFTKSSPFGNLASNTNASTFANSPFRLASTFKGDGSAKDDLPKPTGTGAFGFGSGFGDLLGESGKSGVSPTHDKEEDMDDGQPENSHIQSSTTPQEPQKAEPPKTLITPPSTLFGTKATPAQPVSSLFGPAIQSLKTPGPTETSTGFSFGQSMSTTPKDTPAPTATTFGTKPIVTPTPAIVQKSKPLGTFTAANDRDVQQTTPKASASGEDTPRVTTESPSDEDVVNIKKIPDDAPLPPDPFSKPGFQTGDTSVSSINSSKPDDAPLPPDFLPANKSATSKAEEVNVPAFEEEEDEEEEDEEGEDEEDEAEGDDEADSDQDELSSELSGSEEEATKTISLAEEGEDVGDDAATEHLQTSPESSFRGENSNKSMLSPVGERFTKVSANQDQQQKPARAPLFGEVGFNAPMFPPPKPQESPRSPSPVRQPVTHQLMRSDSRSVSAPVQPRSAIDQRKSDYTQSAIAAKAMQAREQEAARERARLLALKEAQEKSRASEMQALEDNEDERIQDELAQPIQPTVSLDSFITYETSAVSETAKTDIPAQIERLYQDINSMVYTLGINARSLSSFIAYQRTERDRESWPDVLASDAPLDALNNEWTFRDINRLHEGCGVLENYIQRVAVEDVELKLNQCQTLLASEITDLRNKVSTLRKSIHARMHSASGVAPLSAEQASIQHDLRKGASAVQTKLVDLEGELTILRARLADLTPDGPNGSRRMSLNGGPAKPTVEAVTNTVTKMTSMAEKRSADVDVLEVQLKRLGLAGGSGQNVPSTPPQARGSTPRTPGSAASSVYHTPDSRVGGSVRSGRFGSSSARKSLDAISISTEDKRRWRDQINRKKDVAAALRTVLEARKPVSA